MTVPEGWEAVIGLEIHVQLSTRTKMFCRCENATGGEPNTRICPVCTAQPGALPVANGEAVARAIAVGLALGSKIAPRSLFHRKNYFYPDSPKAYQISQFDEPLCVGGSLTVPNADGEEEIAFVRVHLEEDAAKTIHEGGAGGRLAGSVGAVVDFNRCGVPLIEMVTEPVISSPEAAGRFGRLLRQTIVALGASDCDMERGTMRIDANVSVRRPGESELRTKVELKNMNSFSFIERGIARELRRQAETYEAGGEIATETLHYDPARDELTAMRSKELAHDYRYFPEPDLVPLTPSAELIERLDAGLPELPGTRIRRYERDHGLSFRNAADLNSSVELAAYFEQLTALTGDAGESAKWVLNQLSAHLNETGRGAAEAKVQPVDLAALIVAVREGKLGSTGARQAFEQVAGGTAAATAIEQHAQLGAEDEVRAVVVRVVAANPAQAEQFRAGKEALLGYFVGQVMKATGGRAEPRAVQQLLRAELADGS